MSVNRCVYCNGIIPEGRMLCIKCEKDLSADGFTRALTSVWGITPENRICLICKKEDCDGECQEYRKHLAKLKKEKKLHKKQQFLDL